MGLVGDIGRGTKGGSRALLGTWISDLDTIQLHLLGDFRIISNCSRPEFPGLYNGDNNEHLGKIKD